MTKAKILIWAILMGLGITPTLAGVQANRNKNIKENGLTVEQEMQKKYYLYEAFRLFHEEEYRTSFQLMDFCYLLDPDDAMVNFYLGIFYDGLGQPVTALPYYRKAYQLDAENCWYNFALTLYKSEDKTQKEEAVRVMEHVAQLKPTDDVVLSNLETVYIGTGEWKKALKVQDKLDKLNGYDAYSSMNRYRIHVMMGKPKLAIEDVNDYLKEDPMNLQFQMFRVQLLEATQAKPTLLYAAYEEVLLLDPINANVLNNYAYHLSTHKGDLKKAEDMSRKAVQLEPSNAIFLDTYAWILFLRGEKQLAQLYIQKVIDLLNGQKIPREVMQHYESIFTK